MLKFLSLPNNILTAGLKAVIMESFTYLSNAEGAYIESLYTDFKSNPDNVDESWRKFFEGFEFAKQTNGHSIAEHTNAEANTNQVSFQKEHSVIELIKAYRERGHLLSTTNPIRTRKDRHPHLDLQDFNLTVADLNTVFTSGNIIGVEGGTLQDIITKLKAMYCGNIGIEYTYIEDKEIREWVQEQYENSILDRRFTLDRAKRILSKLNEAEVFENFLHTKYVGQKRFSLEGGETTIAALDAIINRSAQLGVKEIAIGMAHRGRLNVLANILGKTYEWIFNEFEGNIPVNTTMGDGDVKYHMGFTSQITSVDGHKIQMRLVANPSHLEAVDAVVLGYARCKADMLYNSNYDQVLPILIHGDAALAGQGVVYEVAQMSNLAGYQVGGTIHFVINNQIGFTTDFDQARTSIYSTAVAYVSESPVFHVNGDDPEAVVFAVELATEFRNKFKKDVYVDMVCYRKYGHNEGDEPKYTQPTLYALIGKHKNPREVYSQMLIDRNEITANISKEMEKEFKGLLQDRLNMVKQETLEYIPQKVEEAWSSMRLSTKEDFMDDGPDTGVSLETLTAITKVLSTVPDNIKPIKKALDLLKSRQKSFNENKLPWAMGELLAYGSLLLENHHIRLSGQDVERGTFSHRHAIITDEVTNEKYNNLNHIGESQAKFDIYNSLLSEFAVLGFEYGYSMTTPDGLTIWEAQFGDFSNGGQVIIDQFISSAESKWNRMNGLVMLLPHGYEGQGPEHSSARVERFLDLAAEYNMVVANCTTPANFFHLIRRQLKWEFRKPLVVFTPKSLLRLQEAVSTVDELVNGKFQPIIIDNYVDDKKVSRVLFCSGKIFYDLFARQQKDARTDVAIVRVEQIYPMPEQKIEEMFATYPNAEYYWVQEEPKNMGSWTYWLRREENHRFKLISRKSSASPAVGHMKVHVQQQQEIVDKAFAK